MKRIDMEELQKKFPIAYKFIKSNDMKRIAEKKYELGNDVYVNIESYDTFGYQERKYESHIKYIDLQCVITGTENIVVAAIRELSIVEKYNADKDITFYSNAYRGTDNYMRAGDMLLLEPDDGHMPCVAISESVHVKKAVFKFPVSKS
jgi:YhcH/YjgK/YiaL family protein